MRRRIMAQSINSWSEANRTNPRTWRHASAAVALWAACTALADTPPLSVLYDGPDGATCEYFNSGARIPWQRRLGDWVDASGKPRGETAFATAAVDDLDEVRVVEWDVTTLLTGDARDKARGNAAMMIRASGGRGGYTAFYTREAANQQLRPRLVVTAANGERRTLPSIADTWTDCSTVKSEGADEVMKTGGDSHLLIQFDPVAINKLAPVQRALLQLTTTPKQYGSTVLGVYRLDPPRPRSGAVVADGIASRYPGDRGIAKDSDVLMATGFESSDWLSEWGDRSPGGSFDVISADAERQFQPFSGRALRVKIPAGKNTGLNLDYKFRERTGSEPEEIYFRYYLRFGNDWAPTLDGGKLPGISGTYDNAGWGGRRSDGTNGWSMRGKFLRMPDDASPLHGRTMVGIYAYHADMTDFYGDNWIWTDGFRGLLERNRWYAIEQYVRINTPGQRDGIVRAWVDGVPVFERAGIRFRDTPRIKIEKVWMNVYHGGTAPAPRTMHLFIDNVVIARRYVGPMRNVDSR
jgi:hypothetical protein